MRYVERGSVKREDVMESTIVYLVIELHAKVFFEQCFLLIVNIVGNNLVLQPVFLGGSGDFVNNNVTGHDEQGRGALSHLFVHAFEETLVNIIGTKKANDRAAGRANGRAPEGHEKDQTEKHASE